MRSPTLINVYVFDGVLSGAQFGKEVPSGIVLRLVSTFSIPGAAVLGHKAVYRDAFDITLLLHMSGDTQWPNGGQRV